MGRHKKISNYDLSQPQKKQYAKTVTNSEFEQVFTQLSFELMKEKMFIPVGLEMSATNIYFEDEKEFALKEMTFAYYSPLDNSIHVNTDHPFFNAVPDELAGRLFFILYHEINHKLLLHHDRMKQRVPNLWNIAGDYEIHNMLYIYKEAFKTETKMVSSFLKDVFVVVEKILQHSDGKNFTKKQLQNMEDDPANPILMFDSNMLENIAEEIYQKIENSKETSSQTYKIKMSGSGQGQGSGSGNQGDKDEQEQDGEGNDDGEGDVEVTVEEVEYTLPNGQKVKSININWPENQEGENGEDGKDEAKKAQAQRSALNRSLMENGLAEMAKGKGDISEDCKKFLKKLFHIKIDWEKILRNSLQTILEKTDYFSWSTVRTSTFLLPNMPYLPDIVEDNEKYGTLIVARDESGSMGDEEIAKAAQIIIDAKAHYKKIVVLKHDTDITDVKAFEDIDDDVVKYVKTRARCGGTSHKEVFEYLRDYKKNFPDEDISCFIGITDLDSDIEHYQNLVPEKVPMVWLAPIGAVEYHKNSGIKGKIIPVEL